MSEFPQVLLEEPIEFVIGQITDLRKDITQNGRSVIVLEITPLGEEVPLLIFFNAANARSRRSKWQRFLRALRTLGVDTSVRDRIVGTILQLQVTEQSATIDGEERFYDVWVPRKLYPDEDAAMADYMELMGGEDQTESGSPAPTGSGIDPDILEAALVVYKSMGEDETAFLQVAGASWPSVDPQALLNQVKS